MSTVKSHSELAFITPVAVDRVKIWLKAIRASQSALAHRAGVDPSRFRGAMCRCWKLRTDEIENVESALREMIAEHQQSEQKIITEHSAH